MQTKEAADASAVEPPEDKKTFDAQVKLTYTREQSVAVWEYSKEESYAKHV